MQHDNKCTYIRTDIQTHTHTHHANVCVFLVQVKSFKNVKQIIFTFDTDPKYVWKVDCTRQIIMQEMKPHNQNILVYFTEFQLDLLLFGKIV